MLGYSSSCGSAIVVESLRMHAEICPTAKLSVEFDNNSTINNSSVLEEDLALSSSTLGPTDKSLQEQTDHETCCYKLPNKVVYVNEDTMDCSYAESGGTPKSLKTRTDISSPEMFESDDDQGTEGKTGNDFSKVLSRQATEGMPTVAEESLKKDSDEELVAKSDCYLLARMNKFLTGVPPPPKHTICQSDCSDLLTYIRENREYFYIDPLLPVETKIVTPIRVPETIVQSSSSGRSFNHRAKSSLRNLTNAFDACDRINESTMTSVTKTTISEDNKLMRDSNIDSDCSTTSATQSNLDKVDKDTPNEIEANLGEEMTKIAVTFTEACTKDNTKDNGKRVTFKMSEDKPTAFYKTISVEEAMDLSWPLAFQHKTHGIHYNRSKTIEEFENLTSKLCQRYIGAETQSSCNVWFTKQTPTSVKKRNLLSRRNNGQSPGKRLSHLARRRRTFSSANLQVLGMADKKQLVLNIRKPSIKKGKSPRGKSPRGSAKKRAGLKVSPSPRKSKLETSKRALFQSPPGDRAGPSGRSTSMLSSVNTNPQQRIKRALFPTSKTKDDSVGVANHSSANDLKKTVPFEETRKRKCEDDLEGPRFKWAKSMSFDCPYGVENSSSEAWTNERHSTGGFHVKSDSQQGKCELSDVHRKKLLWAVAEALRGKGITMGHPRFKQYASQLARTVKKYMPDLENRNIPRKPGSTSDRMLKLAKHHALLIVESNSTE